MILHITNDYSGSTVYKNLIRELDHRKIEQIVYHPIRDISRFDKNKIDFQTPGSCLIYSHILSKYTDRLLYRTKVKKILKDIENKVDLNRVDYIHAHTWYSDGGVAYEIHKKYKIPYVISVRNTDLNLFLKYFLHQREYGRQILLASSHIVTISAVYEKRMLNYKTLYRILPEIRDKIVVVPNGVDPFWINNRVSIKKKIINKKTIELLYIGKFDRGKNVGNLIKAVKILNQSVGENFNLTLIGGNGNDNKRILNLLKSEICCKYVGRIDDLEKIKIYFENCDIFAMPSKAETFGLVYMEALMQGLPILYTENEGIDGFYGDSIGEKVENSSPQEIAKKLKRIVDNYNDYNFNIEEFAINHNWSEIAKIYKKLYII